MSGAQRGALVDRATQNWVRATGRQVELAANPWLDGPIGPVSGIGDSWIGAEAERLHASIAAPTPHSGLLDSMAGLAGPSFDPTLLAAPITDFYEHTTDWRMDVWAEWSRAALPFGRLLQSVFTRRLEQFQLPLRPLDAARGIDSRVIKLVGSDGSPIGTVWQRSLIATGQTVFSGWYGVGSMPDLDGPALRVVFPLPNGNVSIFLEPSNVDDGLLLTSRDGTFGGAGAYLVVRDAPGLISTRRVPLRESFHLYLDDEGTLRTDHRLAVGGIDAVRMHYRLAPTHAVG